MARTCPGIVARPAVHVVAQMATWSWSPQAALMALPGAGKTASSDIGDGPGAWGGSPEARPAWDSWRTWLVG